MNRLLILVCGAALTVACSREPAALSIPTGSQVSVEKSDGVKVEGKLVEVTRDRVIVEQPTGQRTTVSRGDISAIRTAGMPAASAGAADNPRSAEAAPVGSTGTASGSESSNPIRKMFGGEKFREVTIPAGTVLPVDLETSVGSDISRPEQPVRGDLRRAVTVNGVQVLPAGAAVYGHVTTARRPGRVKGRGLIAMRFSEIDTPGGRERMSTATVSRMAPATKEKDALEILAPAAGGAVVGRVVGGKKGAAEGALIGGGAGTAYVLTTRGKEIRLGKGARLAVRLTQPLTVRVPAR
jgi:hypothetical protein